MDMMDCVIVGGGPAGLSASIYLARYNRGALVIDHGGGRSSTHEINENYLGFPDGIASKELRELGRRQAEHFGVCFADAKVAQVSRQEGDAFMVATEAGEQYAGRTLIFATGVRDRLPACEGQDVGEFFGKSLFWCITCDGYKVRDRRVTIAGATDEAATTALQFLNFTPHVAIVTNRPRGESAIGDAKRRQLDAAGISVSEGVIARLHGRDGMISSAELKDGQRIDADCMFNQQGAEPSSALARSLGVSTDESGYIKADTEQRTNVAMVFAAGDVTKEFAHQIVTAAHEGATAGQTANYELYRPEQREGGSG